MVCPTSADVPRGGTRARSAQKSFEAPTTDIFHCARKSLSRINAPTAHKIRQRCPPTLCKHRHGGFITTMSLMMQIERSSQLKDGDKCAHFLQTDLSITLFYARRAILRFSDYRHVQALPPQGVSLNLRDCRRACSLGLSRRLKLRAQWGAKACT